MVMNHMVQLMKQLSGKIGSNVYTAVQGQTGAAQVAFLRQLQREIKKENVLEKPLDELNVVVFDLETTGFFPNKGDQILSIGAVKMCGEVVIEDESFYSLVYSEKEPSEEITQLTGITPKDVQDAPKLKDVLEQFYKFVNSDTLVAHHAHHEKSFMQHATWTMLRTHFQHRVLDTSFLTKVVNPGLDLVTLDDWLNHFGIECNGRHHALQDALMTAKLWSKNIYEAKEKGFSHLTDVYTHIAKMR
ncbi:exonuclease domain-containing protein [Anaerobacillus sp. MEB173]|uniref:exonuclease domain-containing protein n=1 Tax=Anaerobacillus sp. MEB173 TaxID=3383345 RepID=UPI003F8E62E3